MADLSYPAAPVPALGAIQGREPARYTAVAAVPATASLQQDLRILGSTAGTITDQVVLKSGATETPFANGRVWLFRLADGRKAWEGWSDAAGWYTGTGLEVGVKYVAVAIDPYGNQKATVAGPVTAV